MMQKRKLSSLLLISFIVVFAYSFAVANTVDFGTSDQLRCDPAAQAITINPAQEIVGFEIIAEISGDYTGIPTITLSGVPTGWATYTSSRADGVAPDTIRIGAIRVNASDPVIAAGEVAVATLNVTTADACSGLISTTGGDWPDPMNPVGPIATQFIDAGAVVHTAVITDGALNIVNDAPALDPIAGATITWNAPGNTFTVTASGSDDDIVNGCEELAYSLDVNPDGMVIDEETGVINFTANGEQVCINPVTVRVTDICGASATTSFEICVSNIGPSIVAPDDVLMPWGDVATGTFVSDDPDGGPDGPFYEIVSFDGPGAVVLLQDGSYSWDTETEAEYTGVFTLCVSVSDLTELCECNERNADTACVEIEVVPHVVKISKVHGQIQGQLVEITLEMLDDSYVNYPMGGYEFLIMYDASALSFMGAEEGQMLTDCEWEYFTYRTGCTGDGCPSGMIRLVALAEMNDGGNHPECFTNDGLITTSSELARLSFLVSNDRTLECQYVPIRFIWFDCTDNTISDVDGTVLFISGEVYDYYGSDGVDTYNEITNFYADLPSIYGAPIYCDTVNQKTDPYRFIQFFNGGIDIVCKDSIDDRGDINLDGVAYSVADAVMFTNYFIEGLQALVEITEENDYGVVPGYAGSVAATDVNADGLTLTVADLVLLIRVIVGDADPVPKAVVAENATITYSNEGMLTILDDVKMGAAFVVVQGDVTPTLYADMEMKYAFDGVNTRVLVYSLDNNHFTGEFLNVHGDIISVEMATSVANPVVDNLIPSEFELAQNYPNPFNPATTISFNLPKAGDYALTIFNVTGQIVHQISGSAEAGVVSAEWNASSNASGVYFYKLTIDGYSATKKMVLLK